MNALGRKPIITSAVELGLPVFPCSVDKRPSISKKEGGRGFHDASTDPLTIERMFARSNAKLIGVPTGEASGWDCLDLDYRHGAAAFEDANQYRMPETRVHETQSGGRHLVFKHAPGVRNSASSIAPGVDVRGFGGYLIVPPSPGYRVISDAKPVDWPDWLLKLVLPPPTVAQPRPASEPRQPVSSKRIDRLISIALDKVRQAPDGAKHFTLRNQAICLGGLQHLGGFSDGDAVTWLMDALPASAKDRRAAEQTAAWGIETGKARPFELEDRPMPAPLISQPTSLRAGDLREDPPDFEDGYLDSLAADEPAPTKPPRKTKRAAKAQYPDDERPVIRIAAGQLDRLATEAEDTLIASGLPIFQRGSALVRPVTFEVPASRGRSTVSAGLSAMTPPGMIDTYSQVARWERYNKRADDWLPADPPSLVAAVHLSRAGFWKLPPVAGVITTPTLRPDGSVLLKPGYDAATRLFYVPDPALEMPPLIAKPSRGDAEAALALLLGLLKSFPFVSDVARAVALSMLITPVVRGALSVAPLHAAKASTAGTGKSYLVDLASAISTGRPCPVAAAASDPAETEKRLVGLLLSAFPIVSLDNVNGELSGDVLCQAVERPLIRVRPLGASNIIEIESRCCIYATGNALRVCGDMVRRTLLAALDAEMERPELRTFDFDPMVAVLTDRGIYVAACMTIVRAYTAAGSPSRLSPLASFEDWSDLVRSALVWLGQADPCASMEEAREDDPELTDIREMMAGWHGAFGSLPQPVKKAVEAANATVGQPDEHGDVPSYGASYTHQHPELRDVLMRLSGARSIIDGARVGRWLLGHEGRIVGGRRFKRDGITDGAARWKLEQVTRKGGQGG